MAPAIAPLTTPKIEDGQVGDGVVGNSREGAREEYHAHVERGQAHHASADHHADHSASRSSPSHPPWTRKAVARTSTSTPNMSREDEVDGEEARPSRKVMSSAADDAHVGRASPPDDEVAQREEERLEDNEEVRRRRRDESIHHEDQSRRRGRRGRFSSCWLPNGIAASANAI